MLADYQRQAQLFGREREHCLQVDCTLGALQAEDLPLHPQWRSLVDAFWQSEQGLMLHEFLRKRTQSGARIYPPAPLSALALTPFDQVRVVILGQDPYHGAAQAHGLAFSVPRGVKRPPSLGNIFKELLRDTGSGVRALPEHGNLQDWARAGVLLLNTTLTVEEGEPGAHAGRGWETFTDLLIEALARETRPMVFMLWGAHAQSKLAILTASKGWSSKDRLVLCSSHPSPLSARRGQKPFIGNGHFSAARDWLAERGVKLHWGIQN